MTLRPRIFSYTEIVLALLLSCAIVRAAFLFPEPPPLEIARLDLTDGRILRNITIKSYDESNGRLLVLSDRKVTTIPLRLVPEALRERILNAIAHTNRGSGSSAPPPRAAKQTDARADSEPQANTQPERKRDEDAAIAAHRAVALSRAQKYFRYEFRAGSNSISVTALDFETTKPRAVPGWQGRYETSGKAYLEFFDSAGRSYQRRTATFDVLTEEKPDREIEVVSFTPKS